MPGVVCGISTDITERKRAELAERFLAEASRKLMALGYGATLDERRAARRARAGRPVRHRRATSTQDARGARSPRACRPSSQAR